MSAASPEPSNRPRNIEIGFWCWFGGAILVALLGLLTLGQGGFVFVYVVGALLVGVGLAMGFLAGRARRGQERFASAGAGLAMASVAFLAVLLLLGAGIAAIVIVAVAMVLMITGTVQMRSAKSREWFEGAR